ncbi:MAG: hypothetical protein LUG66_04740 [Clostridiales bacterium]|nr:hypothetical protein [Clostridiales bacterium]
MKQQWEKQFKKTAVYLAPSAYGEAVDSDKALDFCKEYIKKFNNLKLMRIYRDEKIVISGGTDNRTGSRSPLTAEGNDAWLRLLRDTETSAVEAVVIYAARTVAPSISALKYIVTEYFIPCGIFFADAEADFNTAEGDADAYFKTKVKEYRSSLNRKPYKKRGDIQ